MEPSRRSSEEVAANKIAKEAQEKRSQLKKKENAIVQKTTGIGKEGLRKEPIYEAPTTRASNTRLDSTLWSTARPPSPNQNRAINSSPESQSTYNTTLKPHRIN